MKLASTLSSAALIGASVLLAACANTMSGDLSSVDRAAVDIGNLQEGGASVQRLTTPMGYKQGDKLVAYEGPGWESDRVAYRLYLDGRNAIDIFGKRTPGMVLSTVGRGDDYHAMADWGMDILKVGNSLGAGGFGVLRGDEAVQIGDAASYTAEVIEDTNERAQLRVTHSGSVACGGDIVADYTIEAGSRLTDVRIAGDCALPLVAGLVTHPGTVIAGQREDEWGYIARQGKQTLADDDLGMALFYRNADVSIVALDNDDHFVVFKPGVAPHYKFGAAWAQEPDNDSAVPDFVAWLDATLTDLNR